MDEPLRRRFNGPGWSGDDAPSSNFDFLDGRDVVEVEQFARLQVCFAVHVSCESDIWKIRVMVGALAVAHQDEGVLLVQDWPGFLVYVAAGSQSFWGELVLEGSSQFLSLVRIQCLKSSSILRVYIRDMLCVLANPHFLAELGVEQKILVDHQANLG